ncbi:hypothetical protein ACTQ40_09770 [Collinsella sp. Sow4_D11]|uniref:hypothetical protein n=1 Tax=Collinsella sp. Sow4_D11 TaxID=3438775 RepID=UPI003F92793A
MISAELWGASGRRAAWRVDLLTNKDVYRRQLDGVTGGSLDFNAFRAVAGGGTLTLEVPSGRDFLQGVDWLADRVAITYVAEVHGQRFEVPWGVFLASGEVDEREHPDGVSVTVPLVDKTAILQDDGIRDHYALPVNWPVVGAVEALIVNGGQRRYALTPSSERTRTAVSWPAGTPRLTIINDLLAAIGYTPLRADAEGVYRSEPYIDPDQRTVQWDFRGGAYSVTAPEWSESLSASGIPNRYVVTTQESEGVQPLVGVAENNNPASAYSYARRGRWITQVEDGADATSQAVVDDLARRKLRDSSRPAVRLPVEHLVLPLTLGDAVLSPTGHHMVVVEQAIKLEPMAMMSSTLRRFEVV